ncbi:hypothetical protein ACEZDB_11845 [Streptacidiphilus sp. N1-3]|uniref:Carboxypeptidase regulatory-like domain-containing protein n=1 Tax=Streptacidiphilus alkalitolerans TaxID=3342712 RepID=A0ABV6X0G0_9ACTN
MRTSLPAMAATTLLTAALALPTATAYADPTPTPTPTPADVVAAPPCRGSKTDGTMLVFVDPQFSSGLLTYGNETVTATGKVMVQEPDGTLAPYAGPWTVRAQLNGTTGKETGGSVAADGSFTVSVPVQWSSGHEPLTLAAAVNHMFFCGPSMSPDPVSEPTRVVLDRSSVADVAAWKSTTVSGILEYQAQDGIWRPAAGQPLSLLGTDVVQYATTGSDGRFSFTQTVEDTPTHWILDARDVPGWDRYLTGSSAGFDVTSILDSATLHLASAKVDAHSRLSVSVSADSTNATVPGNVLYLQQSANGRTSWTTVERIPAKPLPYGRIVTLAVTNPHGYWRLYSPAGAHFPAAYSNTVHTAVNAMELTGGRPNHTTVRRNSSVSFSGHLYQQGATGPWNPVARSYVTLLFRPLGQKTWQSRGRVRTDSHGAFRISGKATTGGTWMVAWYTPDSSHVDTQGPQTYVHA